MSDTFGVHPNLQETGHQDIPMACAAAKASSEASLDSSKTYGRTPGLSQCRGSFQPSRRPGTFLSSALASLRQKISGVAIINTSSKNNMNTNHSSDDDDNNEGETPN